MGWVKDFMNGGWNEEENRPNLWPAITISAASIVAAAFAYVTMVKPLQDTANTAADDVVIEQQRETPDTPRP